MRPTPRCSRTSGCRTRERVHRHQHLGHAEADPRETRQAPAVAGRLRSHRAGELRRHDARERRGEHPAVREGSAARVPVLEAARGEGRVDPRFIDSWIRPSAVAAAAAPSCRSCRRSSSAARRRTPSTRVSRSAPHGPGGTSRRSAGDGRVRRRDDQGERPLLPARVRDSDHRHFDYRGMRGEVVLEVDRRYPLAAGLDHVLRTIGDLHVAAGIDRPHVAGAQPPVLGERCRRSFAMVAPRDPRTAELQLPDRCRRPPRTRLPRSSTSRTSMPGTGRPLFARQPASSSRGTSRGGIERQHIGLVSVIPQPCSTGTPQRARTLSINAGETAEPPDTITRKLDMSRGAD